MLNIVKLDPPIGIGPSIVEFVFAIQDSATVLGSSIVAIVFDGKNSGQKFGQQQFGK